MKDSEKTGLLFYHSCETFTADFARGKAEPTFCDKVDVIEDGAVGKAFSCDDVQKLAFRAPHNIYAERGTLSFFWRSRYPVGPTAFPIFRVGFADHSSWDACWLRIDYNGNGFDAMITDINLSRARVSVPLDPFPAPEVWTHLALSWDENFGIRFYVNGVLAAEEYRPAVYFTGLDQFGPHSRIIANWNVISDYNFIRGGDIDEIAIYDRMLAPEQIAQLSKGQLVENLAPYQPDLNQAETLDGWMLRSGFAPVVPPAIPDEASVRKVEIHDAYDLKRWWWKGCDGIRETTWPGVYNRSRLKGRNDYFQLPDWDCYSLSGKAITFHLPQEPYNHVEISGSAYGLLERVDDEGNVLEQVVRRPKDTERTAYTLQQQTGGKLRFQNEMQEQPIGDFSAFYVTQGAAPKGVKRVSYHLEPGYRSEDPAQSTLADFIKGRYTSYERHIMTACSDKKGLNAGAAQDNEPGGYPFVNVIVPYVFDDTLGLDGVELKLPAPQKDCCFAVQVKDPLWYYRNLAHFTFSAEAGHAKTLWLDLRDRCLPENRCLYLTIACSDPAFSTASLEDAVLTLVYKRAQDAKAEHTLDRFTQVRDVYGHLVEEQPGLPQFEMYNRFMADVTDLLRVSPEHKLGQYYYYDKAVLCKKYGNNVDFTPDYQIAEPGEGVPDWAFQQVQYLKHYKYLINWWIDNRQIENGEFGGGLSDDGDYTSMWPGLAEMGCDPEKILASLDACTDAFYAQGMFTNGLPSIQADELHSAEEGLISLSQCLTAMDANPKYLERAMETARSLSWITGINSAGHRHIRSTYYNGSRMATEAPWGNQQSLSYLALTPAWYLPRYNGNRKVMTILEELASGLAAHYHPEERRTHSFIRFEDDQELPYHNKRQGGEKMVLYPAYRMTGNRTFFDVIPENLEREEGFGMKLARDAGVKNGHIDKAQVAKDYREMNFIAGVREYYNTQGHPWIDRVYFAYDRIQRDRMGGVAHARGNVLFPQNRMRWRFEEEGQDEALAILTPVTLENQVKMVVYNLSDQPVTATLFGKETIPGTWIFAGGVDSTGNDEMDAPQWSFEAPFEWSQGVSMTFAPGVTTVVTMKLKRASTPYANRCDLGIGKEDIHLWPHGLNVTVHSLGSLPSPETSVVLRSPEGKILRREILPPLEAPTDLWPKWREVSFNLHGIPSLEGCTVEIDPEHKLEEITRDNNIVTLHGI